MTTPDLTKTDFDELERMMDRTSVAALIDGLADICGEKAEHIRSAWQDHATAADWDHAARILRRIVIVSHGRLVLR